MLILNYIFSQNLKAIILKSFMKSFILFRIDIFCNIFTFSNYLSIEYFLLVAESTIQLRLIQTAYQVTRNSQETMQHVIVQF